MLQTLASPTVAASPRQLPERVVAPSTRSPARGSPSTARCNGAAQRSQQPARWTPGMWSMWSALSIRVVQTTTTAPDRRGARRPRRVGEPRSGLGGVAGHISRDLRLPARRRLPGHCRNGRFLAHPRRIARRDPSCRVRPGDRGPLPSSTAFAYRLTPVRVPLAARGSPQSSVVTALASLS